VSPRHDLVEQDQPGPRRQGARQLEPLLLGERETAGRAAALGGEADEVEDVGGGPPGAGERLAPAPEGAGDDVVEHGHPGKRLDDLKRPRQPEGVDPRGAPAGDRLTREADLTAVRHEEPGNDRKQRRLARSVGPDDAHDLAGRDAQRDTVEGGEAAEALGHPAKLEQGRHAARSG
jgi:hypothetical protein